MDTPHDKAVNWAPLAGALAVSVPTLAVVSGACLEAWRSSGSIVAGGGHGWLPYAIVSGLLVVAALLSGAAAVPPPAVRLAIGLLLGLAAWAALSLEWSPVPSLARDEGLLTAFYAVALAVPVLTLRRPLERSAALTAVTFLLTGFALAVAATLAFGTDPLSRFAGGRLYFPITYANAQGAFFALAFWPAAALAATKSRAAPARIALVGAAATLLAATTLAQSKGTVLGFAGALLVLVCATPERLRLLVPVAIAVAIAAAAFRTLTEPFRTVSATSVRHAGLAVLAAGAAGVALGAVYVYLDRRVDLGVRQRRLLGRAAAWLAVLTALGLTALFFAAVPHPGRWASDQWASFKHLKKEKTSGSHFTSLGSNRYDYWRVAIKEFEREPIAGCGARCFGPEYLLERRSGETPVRAHSLPLEVLGEQGLVGFSLLAGALGLLGAALWRGARSRDGIATAALGSGTCWLLHSSVDWIWTFPAVTATAFVIIGIGVSGSTTLLPRRLARGAAAGAAAIALLGFTPVALSSWLAAQALNGSSASPARDLRWARRLDPVSTQPLIAQALTARSAAAELRYLREAARKEPRVIATQYYLGVAYLNLGRRAEARAQLERARRLDPRNPSVLRALALAQRQ
jgi:hypothetical protein